MIYFLLLRPENIFIMRTLGQYVRRYPFSVTLIIVVWYLSFFTPPKIEALENVSLIDKWTHIVMYGGTCGVIWIEYIRHHVRLDGQRLFLLAWLAPVAMSGLIEILQENCTGGRRSGDWMDFAANIVGVSLAALFGVILSKTYPTSKRGNG